MNKLLHVRESCAVVCHAALSAMLDMIAALRPAVRVVKLRSLGPRPRSVKMASAAVETPPAVSTEYSTLCKKLKELSALNGAPSSRHAAACVPLCHE